MLGHVAIKLAAISTLLVLYACAPQTTQNRYPTNPGGVFGTPQQPAQRPIPPLAQRTPQLSPLSSTIEIEHADRVKRFDRLADIYGIPAPQIDQLRVNPGQIPGVNFAVPVVRVIFDEKVFFDFNKDQIRYDAETVLAIIAENMRRDVPDAQLLVLGHTDAIGSDQYNMDLSRRRALSVIRGLVSRGVNPDALRAIPIGKRQPIAQNSTEEGRARNRRVEFMISARQDANLSVIENRQINAAYLKVNPDDRAEELSMSSVEVLKPVVSPDAASPTTSFISLGTVTSVSLAEPTNSQEPELRQPTPVAPPTLNRLEVYQKQPLNNYFVP